MATWVEIVDTATDPDAPLTSDLAKAWTDNVIAVTEGAENAPKVRGQALGIYAGSHDLSGGVFTVTDIPRLGVFRVHGVLIRAASRNLEVSLSNDNGSTWGAWQVTGVYHLGGADTYFDAIVDLENGQSVGTRVTPGANTSIVAITVPSGTDAIRFRASAAVDAGSVLSGFVVGGM